jgi:hypothetical protein
VRIDRPAEDDTPRATTPEGRAADTPPAAAGHEAPDRAAYAAGYRASVDAANREYQAAREWDEAVPALQETWKNHEKKWPSPERTGPTPHPETPGAWRGDGGRYLAPDANAEVTRDCARIREVGETIITPAMHRIEAEAPDRHLAGLDHRLKDPDRLKEKVADNILYKGRTPEEALGNVKDAIRFTFVYPQERYSAGVLADCERLQASGFERFDRVNSWPEEHYKGINSRWRESDSGQLFEVQFHTRASFEAKQLTHGAYERLRSPVTSDVEREELDDFQRAVCAKIPIPPGATDIEDYRPEKRDGRADNLLRDRRRLQQPGRAGRRPAAGQA